MSFHSRHLHFAIFDDADGPPVELDGRTTGKLHQGILSAFQRSKKMSIGVSAVAILSDSAFLARDDAKTIHGIIRENGATIKESFGTMVKVESKEGHSIRIFLLGGASSLLAAMEDLHPLEEIPQPAAAVDLTGDDVVDLTVDAPPVEAPPVGRAARAAKREAAKRELILKKAKAAIAKLPDISSKEYMQPSDEPTPCKLKSALKPVPKAVVIKLEGDQDDLGTPPPKTVYRKTPVPEKEASKQQARKTKSKKAQPADTPPFPPLPDTPSVVVDDDDESTKLDDGSHNSDSTGSYQDFNGMGFTQEALLDAQHPAFGQLVDEFLAEKLPETPDSVRAYMGKPIMSKKEKDRRTCVNAIISDSDDS